MAERILVAYASTAGSTREVAQAIGKALGEGDAAVDVLPAKRVKDLSPYRAVVVGAAIHMSKWLPEAARFVNSHREALNKVPVAYFGVCITLKDDTEENRCTVAAWMEPMSAYVKPVATGMFAGRMAYNNLPFVQRLMVRNMVKIPEGDYRQWEVICAWALKTAPLLAPQ
jgi:menaquinone-dependent protoporphyrinogen oxidase